MKNPVGWFEIYVDDLDRALSFYETVLRVTFDDIGNPAEEALKMKAFPSDMEQYGASGALVHMEGVLAGGNSVMVYFSCDDCAVEESRVAGAGGEIIRPKFSIGEYGFVALARDTEGNMFGLHSLK
jgi:predicted enzyme related to lactoylglutathione lyase